MADYRAYFLDGGGHIRHHLIISANSDREAINLVVRLDDREMTVEIWQLARVIASVEPSGRVTLRKGYQVADPAPEPQSRPTRNEAITKGQATLACNNRQNG